ETVLLCDEVADGGIQHRRALPRLPYAKTRVSLPLRLSRPTFAARNLPHPIFLQPRIFFLRLQDVLIAVEIGVDGILMAAAENWDGGFEGAKNLRRFHRARFASVVHSPFLTVFLIERPRDDAAREFEE